jgi:hypothetical protein
MMNPPYARRTEDSSSDKTLVDASSRMASKIRIFEAARAKKTVAKVTTPTSRCPLLDLLPPEIRNMIWQNVIKGGKYKYNPLTIKTISHQD